MLTTQDRVALISGANRGIGRAVAAELDRAGYRLSLGARDPASLADLADRHLTHAWDALQPASSAKWVEATLARYGRIDALVLNAGVLLPVGMESGSDDDLDMMWAVNFKGPLHLVRAALPALRRSGTGRIANVASLAGKRLLSPDALGYAASKHAAMALTHAIRQHGWADGIRATAICPGLVETDMTEKVSAPQGQYKILPETIAATIAHVLALPNEATIAEVLINSRIELSL